MYKRVTLAGRFYRSRASWRRRIRLLFPSPAELKLIHIVGGHSLTLPWLRHPKTGFSFAVVLWRGRLFRREHVRREVRAGKCFIDFGNDIGRGIEVDSNRYHTDVLKELERDEYLEGYGWQILHVRVIDIMQEPERTYKRVSDFLTA